ncbi:MAG: sorbosone dehydrogenase family protein, partial [Betaproteobacteria bacterium]
MKSPERRDVLPSWSRAAIAVGATLFLGTAVHAQALKSYDSTKKEFWEHPPADWFLGDETPAQKGLAPDAAPALPASEADLEKNLKAIKLPPGFKISVYA